MQPQLCQFATMSVLGWVAGGTPSVAEGVRAQVTEQGIKPAAQAIAEQAVPAAEQLTEGKIKPAAQYIADNVSASVCRPIGPLPACQHALIQQTLPANAASPA